MKDEKISLSLSREDINRLILGLQHSVYVINTCFECSKENEDEKCKLFDLQYILSCEVKK